MLIYSQRLANAIKKTRSELGLTQEEVAALLPVIEAVLTALCSSKGIKIE